MVLNIFNGYGEVLPTLDRGLPFNRKPHSFCASSIGRLVTKKKSSCTYL
jgi:hypothetical protein